MDYSLSRRKTVFALKPFALRLTSAYTGFPGYLYRVGNHIIPLTTLVISSIWATQPVTNEHLNHVIRH
jgi:hypothetical protein